MVERAPQTKQEEQYPLLKVDGGGGDGKTNAQGPDTVAAPDWSVNCSSKRSWLMRWPEYVSACWMTCICLGISFLVFYALALEAYRRQPLLIIKCNTSKPASDVFYHHIVQRESPVPFMLYSEYLASMAIQYPYLHFHIIFLMDDSMQNAFRGPRHNRFINKLIPYSPYPISRVDENNKRELRDFRRKFQNVNVTILPLSKYMAMTPLKYKWRTIPLSYIPFYARIFSVWQNGGIGMDLSAFNNNFHNRQFPDRRVLAILKQHNEGIQPEEYTNALNKIDREEKTEFFSLIYEIIHQALNETRSFLTKNFAVPQVFNEKESQNKLLIRKHRNKRDAADVALDKNTTYENENSSAVHVKFMNVTNETDLKRNEYKTVSSIEFNFTNLNVNDPVKPMQENFTNIEMGFNKSGGLEITNKTEVPQMILFYDFSLFSDGLAPSYVSPEALLQPNLKPSVTRNSEAYNTAQHGNTVTPLLSIDAEGLFVAASSRLHPFLGYLVPAGCQGLHPRFAIHDAFITQCSGIFREEAYCNNIFLL